MAMGLGAFTEGLQGGIAARDAMDKNRQYKRLLEQRAHLGEMEISGINDTLEASGYDRMDFEPMKDPALIRFGGWLKQKMGFGGGEGTSSTSGISEDPKLDRMQNTLGDVDAAQFQGVPTRMNARDGGRVRRMADGGGIPRLFDEEGNRRELTDEERRHRSYGQYYVTEEEAAANRAARSRGEHRNRNPYHQRYSAGVDRQGIHNDLSGGGLREYGSDLARTASESHTAQALRNIGDVSEASVRNVRDAGGARATGNAVRGTFQDAGAGALNLVGGIASDLGLDKAAEFAGGFIGFDGKSGVPEQQAPADAPAGADAATEATAPAPDKSDEQIAQQAIQEGEEAAAENFDYRYLPEDTRPEDLPSMSTRDWSINREKMFEGLLKRGMNPSEAMQQVDDVTVGAQMRGMQRELQKAMTYMEMGDLRAAGFAIRQGFQYFPNGVDVRLAIQTGPNGQRALVAMGTDEETGEPTGQPMLITGERLATLAENFSNPSAFRTWTKDGRDLQMRIAQLKDLSAYRQDSLDIQRSNAITSRLDALGGGAGGRGGLRASDVDRRSGDVVEALREYEFVEDLPEGVGQELAAVGELVMQLRPNWGPQQIAKGLRDAWNGQPGGEAGVIEYLESLRGE